MIATLPLFDIVCIFIRNKTCQVYKYKYIIKQEKMFSGGNIQDQMLKSYIDQIFDKYDTDRSGTLDEQEMTYFFNDLFKSLGMNVTVTEQQSL